METAKLFVENYPWYNMSPTVYKILIHGPEIMKASKLPIGMLSEEAQEASNKILKKLGKIMQEDVGDWKIFKMYSTFS